MKGRRLTFALVWDMFQIVNESEIAQAVDIVVESIESA